MAITADRLIAGVKRRVTIPASQVLLQDADILAFADDMISSRIVPILESVNQEYFVRQEEIPLVAGQSVYDIPYRAVGRALRDLKIQDANNNLRNLAMIALEDAQVYDSSSSSLGFYFIGDKFRLVPDVPSSISVSQSILAWYRLPPNHLCKVADAALITSISSPNIVVSAVPSTMIAGTSIDFIQAKSGSSILGMDVAITGVAGTTITFAADDIPDDLQAGDYISLAQTSPVINFVPNEMYSLIESYTATRVLQSIGDFEGLRVIAEDISVEEKNMKMMLEPRIDGEPTIIINRWGLVRGNKFAQRRWLYGN